ncbi:MAG: flagellar basal body-associated FliL family protein [Eubacteriales bacterium]|nr:flagellar basal body-associated FliL family protein [Eubacteriales bacterium]
MKKNLMSVIIFAICVVNLILNIIIVFVCMPSAKKTNNLITNIASVLELELEGKFEKPTVALENMAVINIDAQVVNLSDDGSGDKHYVQMGLTLGLDSSAEEYASLSTVLTDGSGAVFDEARNVVQRYTYAEVTNQATQEKIKDEILQNLQKRYGTTCIYSVSFSKFTTQ